MSKCIAFPPVTEEDLLRHLDEPTTSSPIARHLEQCPHCHDQAERLARIQQSLTARLFRSDCPSAQTLGEFHLEFLEPEVRRTVAEHLRICPHCRQEVDSIGAFMQATEDVLVSQEPPPMRKIVATLLPPATIASSQQFALRVLRGAAHSAVTSYLAEDIQVALGVERDRSHPGQKVLIGLITQLSRPERTFENVAIELLQDERAISRVATDDLGSFAIEDLRPGKYKLSLITDEQEIVIDPVRVY